mgnify:CR=1 FL=1
MKHELPKIRRTIDQKEIHWCLEENYNLLSIEWFKILSKWLFNSYSVFKDHNKYLILIFLVKKTFDFYATNFVKLSWDQFFALKKIELGKFNIIDISKELKISRETTRRKIEELERDDIIKKSNSEIVVQTKFYNEKFIMDHKDFRKSICIFASKFSVILSENKIIKEKISSDLIEKFVSENFSYAWKAFFEMLLPISIGWKDIFQDLETWHIYGTVLVNQNYEIQKILKSKNIKIKNRKDFLKVHSKIKANTGINAMSISTLTGIPRATVIRKLNKLIKKKYLIIDSKKLYSVKVKNSKDGFINKQTSVNIERLSIFLTKIINLTITSR